MVVAHAVQQFQGEIDRTREGDVARPQPVEKHSFTGLIHNRNGCSRRRVRSSKPPRIHTRGLQARTDQPRLIVVPNRADQPRRHTEACECDGSVCPIAANVVFDCFNKICRPPANFVYRTHQNIENNTARAKNACAHTTSSLSAHWTCCTGPTARPHSNAPARTITAATTNAIANDNVCSTTKPVNQDAATPERFPMPFCKLVQRPAARGPASVCVIAQWFDVNVPNDAHDSSRRVTAIV